MTDLLTNQEILALIVMLGITLGSTELLKRLLRRAGPGLWHDRWPPRAVAVAVGAFTGVGVWPLESQIEPIWAGLFVGLTAPTLYRVGVAIVARRYPGVAAAITGRKAEGGDDAGAN